MKKKKKGKEICGNQCNLREKNKKEIKKTDSLSSKDRLRETKEK
ncbi:MAG TPA: hypothetical protein PK649_08955 [Vicingus sp.]|nr:hypothetical protein [Vicingus sp.]